MVEQRFSPADELQRAAELLFKDWKLALPTAIASCLVVATIFFGIFGAIGAAIVGGIGGSHTGVALGVGTGLLVVALIVPLGFAVLALAQAIVVAESGAAWEGRPFDFARGFAAVRAHLGDLLIALLITSIGFAVFALLSFFLIGIPLLIGLAYVTIYVQPAILLGNERYGDAFKTSFRLAKTFVGESVLALVGIVAAAIAGNILNAFVVHVPLINLVAGFVIGGFTSAYGALVSARFYALLQNAQAFDVAPFAYGSQAPPPPPES